MEKIIKIITKEDYNNAIKSLERLLLSNPDPNSTEGEKLSILSQLIKDYENSIIFESFPTPVEAINFRMEQAGLTPNDLVPFLGSRSRVSEILSGKRQLSLEMIRSLEEGLGIPAKVLIRKNSNQDDISDYKNWDKNVVKEMKNRGYFDGIKETGYKIIETFLSGVFPDNQVPALLRKSHFRTYTKSSREALLAWSAYVYKKSKTITIKNKYKKGIITEQFLTQLIKLSSKENGPLLAQKFLLDNGIILIIEPPFQKTYLDGISLLIEEDRPVIGLTLRHDRLDNFWFTLLHELAHICLHSDSGISVFYDELSEGNNNLIDQKEKEADNLAQQTILPDSKWEISAARLIPSPLATKGLADELEIHPAVIAGQIRFRNNNYIYLNKIIKEATVRNYFFSN